MQLCTIFLSTHTWHHFRKYFKRVITMDDAKIIVDTTQPSTLENH
jgi:energy-coupling factor transporter ATP-binding protein EcfA2